ncbi:uncharacterized protein PHACADRAFT_256409 [Phanerochaete carnosa HHB-10118-sp]|uniref:Uncharacterized protein n=1 Tax=Phanerochaete carnosa (strain HHB-10118-sp) TaxID=650164 RepID=K5WYQ4_PHACS|nr:uncharacterized protein PHACADRAFT_256409 [Phanerochaete carnosa HHB-10118-sp]EKM55642.1 hypothetical protein PHACADRAFT_256409 [Phanerochaete carnosa HHB-10118-sp]
MFTIDGRLPVNLWEALHTPLSYLDGAQDLFFDGCGTKITYRILVDGYREFSKQMNAQRRYRGLTLPISRSKVAKQIAQVVSKFIECASEVTANSELRFGPGYITLDQIYLVELRQVSSASFQPILAVLCRQLPQVLPTYAQVDAAPGGFSNVLTEFASELQCLTHVPLSGLPTYSC